jgi:hypothetical protein
MTGMEDDLSDAAQAAIFARAKAFLGKDIDRIMDRAVKVFGKVPPDHWGSIVHAALAKASAAVIAEINDRKFVFEEADPCVVVTYDDENDVGLDLDYLARIKAGLSPQAWRLVRDFVLPCTVWRAFSTLEPVH